MHCSEITELLLQIFYDNFGHDLLREVTDDDKKHRTNQCRDERISERPHNKRLHQHDDTKRDNEGRQHFPRSAAESK